MRLSNQCTEHKSFFLKATFYDMITFFFCPFNQKHYKLLLSDYNQFHSISHVHVSYIYIGQHTEQKQTTSTVIFVKFGEKGEIAG